MVFKIIYAGWAPIAINAVELENTLRTHIICSMCVLIVTCVYYNDVAK